MIFRASLSALRSFYGCPMTVECCFATNFIEKENNEPLISRMVAVKSTLQGLNNFKFIVWKLPVPSPVTVKVITKPQNGLSAC